MTRVAKYDNISSILLHRSFFMNISNYIKNIVNLGEKVPLASSVFAGIIIAICLLGVIMPQATCADFENTTNAAYVAKVTNEAKKDIRIIKAVMTAYSSTPDQTDDSPFITASNKYVRDGIVANNLLPFGTKVKIPALYGDKIFVVEDRMNKRMGNHRFDIWMPDRTSALIFGVKSVEIVVLES